MLTEIELNQSVDKQGFKEIMPPLQKKLAMLQQRVRDAGLPVLIVFEGWGASGKGTSIGRLVNPLDPRYFDVLTMGRITEEMLRRPFLWGYWCRIPAKGQITIIDKSWHRVILPVEQVKWAHTEMETNNFYADVQNFERQLTQDGTLIIKLFLHISRSEQLRRFKSLEDDASSAWRVKPHDWAQNQQYNEHLQQFEKMLEQTDSPENPWHIIESDDRRHAAVKICKTIADAIEKRLDSAAKVKSYKATAQETTLRNAAVDKPQNITAFISAPTPAYTPAFPRRLANTDPNQHIENGEYKRELEFLQARMNRLGHKIYLKRRPAVIVYEGWDAAGKGGNIKRLVEEMDPRGYTVVPIGPPTPQELSRHYLWRFMRRMPKDGHFTIFDRSWYGRVLIERVENLTPAHIWQRAYDEINEMEAHLINHGAILFKFWLHIDKAEQLKRFESRMENPTKQHKITGADWQNRENWDAYEIAVDEMFAKTDTPLAPWVIVESNNKKFARVKTLQTVTDVLDAALR